MTKERVYHTATRLAHGRVLVAGGDMDSAASAELYDPVTGRWAATGAMRATTRANHTATLLPDGRVLVAGGVTEGGTGGPLASTELYDPVTGRWTATGSMSVARVGHTATLLPDGTVLVAGGIDLERMWREMLELTTHRTAERYDPATGRWVPTGSMAEGRTGHTATLIPDGRVLVAGGDMDGAESSELYDPTSGAWTATGSMADGRRHHAATLLADGRVLVGGGFAGSDYTLDEPCSGTRSACTAELYDPDTGRWTATGSLHADRSRHTATLLRDGTVLVVGTGLPASPIPAELYDPRPGEWRITASPQRTRGLTATLLADGRVLSTGGFYDHGRAAELYLPGKGP